MINPPTESYRKAPNTFQNMDPKNKCQGRNELGQNEAYQATRDRQLVKWVSEDSVGPACAQLCFVSG